MCYEVKRSESRLVVSSSLQPHGLYSPWNSPGQNTGVGILALLQGIFPTQGLNPGLSHCRQVLDQLSHQGSPRILEWVAYPFPSRSSQPRNRTALQMDSLPTELSGKPGMQTLNCGIEGLVPQPGIKPSPPTARSLNHWATREVPSSFISDGLKARVQRSLPFGP